MFEYGARVLNSRPLNVQECKGNGFHKYKMLTVTSQLGAGPSLNLREFYGEHCKVLLEYRFEDCSKIWNLRL